MKAESASVCVYQMLDFVFVFSVVVELIIKACIIWLCAEIFNKY